MSGWDEGAVYYSDQAHSWRGSGEDHDPEVGSRHSVLQKFKEFIRGFETDESVFPYRESLVHNPNKSLLVDLEDRDSATPTSQICSAPPPPTSCLFLRRQRRRFWQACGRSGWRDWRNGRSGDRERSGLADVEGGSGLDEVSWAGDRLDQYISKLVKIAGIAIAASRTNAKATYVTLICKHCRNSKRVPCRPGLGGAIVPRSCDHIPQPGEQVYLSINKP